VASIIGWSFKSMSWRCEIAKLKISQMDQLADGQMKMVSADGKEILLARVGNNIYATQTAARIWVGIWLMGRLRERR